MKHIIRIGLFLLLLSFVCTCVVLTTSYVKQDARTQTHYHVYIDDVQAAYYAMRTPDTPYIMLPFLALVESLGGTVSWENDTTAYLSFAGKTWEFDFEHVRLFPKGSSSNLLCPPPGSTEGMHTIKSKRDAYVDSKSLEHLLRNYLCVKMVDIDDAQRVVRIYTK